MLDGSPRTRGVLNVSERPIFVVGFQRSGTTMLQSILGRHPRIAAAPELYYWLRVFLVRDQLGDLADDEVLARVVDRALDVPLGLWRDTPVQTEAVLDRVRASERTYEGVLRAIMAEFAADQGKPRWSEKSPGQHVAQSLVMVPEAQVVHIVRRVDDVVASNLCMPWRRETAHEIAAAWSTFNLRAIRDGAVAGPSSYFRVRYEDLVRDPERVLRLVCTFLDESFDDRMLERQASSAVSDVGRDWQGLAEEPVLHGRRGHRTLGWVGRLQVVGASRAAAPAFGYGHGRRDRALARLVAVTALPGRTRAAGKRWLRTRWAWRDPDRRVEMVDRLIAENRRALHDRGTTVP